MFKLIISICLLILVSCSKPCELHRYDEVVVNTGFFKDKVGVVANKCGAEMCQRDNYYIVLFDLGDYSIFKCEDLTKVSK